jgi:hypothetical protein
MPALWGSPRNREDMSVEPRLSPTSIDTRRTLRRTRTNLESEDLWTFRNNIAAPLHAQHSPLALPASPRRARHVNVLSAVPATSTQFALMTISYTPSTVERNREVLEACEAPDYKSSGSRRRSTQHGCRDEHPTGGGE